MNIFKKFQVAFIRSILNMVRRYPVAIIVCGILLAAVCAGSSALWLKLDSDQDNLISHNLPFQKRNIEQIKNFGDQEYMFVVIKTGGTEEGKATAATFATTLAEKLEKRPDLVREVHYAMSAKDMGPGVLMFATPDQLRDFVGLARNFGPLGRQWFEDPGLTKFLNISSGLLSGKGGGTADPEMFTPVMGALDALVGEMQSSMQSGMDNEGFDNPVLGLDKAGINYFLPVMTSCL